MKQWDVFMFPFTREKRHPAVILSNDERCNNPDLDRVNVLLCTSVRVQRGAKLNEVVLDESDGLDWPTFVRCDIIYLLAKAEFQECKGRVSEPRRRLIARTMVQLLRLPL